MRILKSYPAKERRFTQYTSLNGVLHGPCLMEMASGRIDSGYYFNSNQHGLWKFRYSDGRVDHETFNQGELIRKDTIQQSPGLRPNRSRSPESSTKRSEKQQEHTPLPTNSLKTESQVTPFQEQNDKTSTPKSKPDAILKQTVQSQRNYSRKKSITVGE